MAQYNGFTCDSCGKVMSPDERTKVTLRYEGPVHQGECFIDKCPDCVGEPPKPLKPLRRRRSRQEDPAS